MRQADLSQGFIIDVLQNYSTYKRFFGLDQTRVDSTDAPKTL